MARRGASVVVNDTGASDHPGKSRADIVVDEIRATGGRAVASQHDVKTIAGGQAITDLALNHFGSVHVVINNAGMMRRAMFETASLDLVKEVIDVHLTGAFNVTQPAWKVMKNQKYGRIVMTSSSASFGMQGNSNYVAAKAGLLGLVAALSLEGGAFDIKVNGILPFAKSMITVDSPATAIPAPDAALNVAIQDELGERGSFRSVSAAALYLASNQCVISGQAISALAGRYARSYRVVTDGWLAPDVHNLSPEDFRDHLERVLDPSSVVEMKSMTDEFAGVLDRVRSMTDRST
jgi:NAD(P)-dependent dehydrogenase (short-subunit alcohol dehydrogenase family)